MTIAKHIIRSGKADLDIAIEVGVDPATVWRWRKGKGAPRYEHLAKLAKAIGVEPAALLGGDEQRNDTAA